MRLDKARPSRGAFLALPLPLPLRGNVMAEALAMSRPVGECPHNKNCYPSELASVTHLKANRRCAACAKTSDIFTWTP
ncbi:MAG: hypothetical protein MJD61_20760 [Proteobacteria bacterium]|nr:hypothetical protein [Pseudomonadota bacterium]